MHSLYDKLYALDNFPDFFVEPLEKFREKMEIFEGIEYPPVDWSNTMSVLTDMVKIDTTGAQRTFIEGEAYSNNVLSDALTGKRSLSDQLEELSEVNEGFRRFMPRFKDNTRNIKVEQMEKLVGIHDGTSGLRSNGISIPDNTITRSIYLSGIFSALMGIFTQGNPYTIAMGPVFGSVAELTHETFLDDNPIRVPNKNLPWRRAEYLDQKISEFF